MGTTQWPLVTTMGGTMRVSCSSQERPLAIASGRAVASPTSFWYGGCASSARHTVFDAASLLHVDQPSVVWDYFNN